MSYNSYELILSEITYGESIFPFNYGFEDYKKMAFSFLNHKGKYLFAEDILQRYQENVSLEDVLEKEKDHFLPAANHTKDGKMERTWHDIQSMEEILSSDNDFDFFFACKLKQLGIIEISEFLSFHLGYSFKNDKQAFLTFIYLPLKQYYLTLLNPNIIEVIQKWIDLIETNDESKEDFAREEKIKGRIPREAGDHLTTLNLNQTALLIQFMQQSGIILKGDYLTYTQAGKAFNILTGYSFHTIRQQLGIKGEIEGVKFEDYEELYQVVLRLASLIETKIRKK